MGISTAIRSVFTPEQTVGTAKEADSLRKRRVIDGGHQIKDRQPVSDVALVHCNLQMEQDEFHHQTRWNNSR